MSRFEKLLAQLQNRPRDFRWDDLVKVLAGLGYMEARMGKTSGSRRRFEHATAAPILLHKPHPQPTLKAYQVELVLKHLQQERLL